MSGEGEAPKKLSLKERMALKKSKGGQDFVPTQDFVPEPQLQIPTFTPQIPQIPDHGLGLLPANLVMTPELFNAIAMRCNHDPSYMHLLSYYYPNIWQPFYEIMQANMAQQQNAMMPDQYAEQEQEEEMEDYNDAGQDAPAERGLGGRIENPKGKKKGKKGPGANQGNALPQPKKKVEKKEVAPIPVKKNVEEVVDIKKISEKEKNKEKLLDMTKEPMNIIFIGHVDSGKSTMCGTILLLSGKVDMEEYRKYEIEAKEKGRLNWLNAYIMDINEEEREKAVTVEIGKASFELEKKRFTIIDCPGHKNYVPNMIGGASQADIACLVISAKSGEFEAGFEKGGQSREHAILAAYLGSSHLVVIINKMDDNNWDIKRFNQIKDTMTPFLRDICEYDVEKSVTWVPVSAMNQHNMKEKVPESICSWYTGESLLDTLDNIPKHERVYRDCLRMPITDKHHDKGDLILYSKIESGSIKENMKLMIMPIKKEVTCLKIQDQEDRNISFASTGDNIKVFIKGIDPEEIKRGFVLCGLQYLCHVAYEFEAELTVMDPPANKVISNGFPAVLHLHSIQEEVEISVVKSNKNQKKSGGLLCLKQGDTGKVIIKVHKIYLVTQ